MKQFIKYIFNQYFTWQMLIVLASIGTMGFIWWYHGDTEDGKIVLGFLGSFFVIWLFLEWVYRK